MIWFCLKATNASHDSLAPYTGAVMMPYLDPTGVLDPNAIHILQPFVLTPCETLSGAVQVVAMRVLYSSFSSSSSSSSSSSASAAGGGKTALFSKKDSTASASSASV